MEKGVDTKIGADAYLALYNQWKAGNLEGYALVDEDMPKAVRDEYIDTALTRRNRAMADAVMQLMDEGKSVFVAVGAAHLSGAGSIADLLANAGYTVEPIS